MIQSATTESDQIQDDLPNRRQTAGTVVSYHNGYHEKMDCKHQIIMHPNIKSPQLAKVWSNFIFGCIIIWCLRIALILAFIQNLK